MMQCQSMFRTGATLLLMAMLAGVFAGGTFAPAYAAPTVVTVTDSDPQGWVVIQDNGPNGSGDFVAGPATPPLSTGSVELKVNDSSAGYILTKAMDAGTPLSEITSLSYSTYRSAPVTTTSALAISLAFNMDHDVTVADTTFQGRLVYEPYYSGPAGTVQPNVWQTWNPLATSAKWWRSKPSGDPNDMTSCIQSSPCTVAQLLAIWPNIGIHPIFGAVVFKAGSGWSSFTGNIDAFTIGISNVETTYDFNAAVPGVTVTQSDGTTAVDETGPTSDSYTLTLDKKPTTPVTMTLAITDGQTLLSTDGATFTTTGVLSFTDLTWSTPQIVTVQAVDDALIETTPHTGTIQHAIAAGSDTDYVGLAIPDLAVSIADNDVAGVVVTQSGGSTDVAETGPTSDTYTLALSAQPTAPVTVTLVITDGQTTAAPDALVFTPATWNVTQTVTVTAVDDAAIEASIHQGLIGHEIAASSAPEFIGASLPTLTVNVTDNDSAGVTLVQSGGSVEVKEAGPTSDTYTLVLNTQPTANVTVTPVITDGQTTVAPKSLVFTPANWNVPQPVTVTAVDDAIVETSPHFGKIAHTISSADTTYATLTLPTLNVSITDNDSKANPTNPTYALYLPMLRR